MDIHYDYYDFISMLKIQKEFRANKASRIKYFKKVSHKMYNIQHIYEFLNFYSVSKSIYEFYEKKNILIGGVQIFLKYIGKNN